MTDNDNKAVASGLLELHSAVFAAAADPIYVCTPDFIVAEANEPYAVVCGLMREEALGKRLPDLIGAATFSRRKPFLDSALAGHPATLQDWVNHSVLGQRFFDVRYQPVRDASGGVVGVVAFGRDITDLQQAGDALRMHRSVVSQMSDRISIIGRDFRYRMTNESNALHHRTSTCCFVGRHLADVIGEPRFYAEVKQRFERCFLGERIEYDKKERRPDGTMAIVSTRLEPFRNQQGDIDGAVVILRDVTETRRMESRLERLALEDELTGTANRRAFENWVAARLDALAGRRQDLALVAKQGFSIVFIDLDDFKIINDTVGHGAGDRFLWEIANRLRGLENDRVHAARIGGDEFGLVIDGADRVEARSICDKVVRAFDGFHFTWEGMRFRAGASVGLARVDPDLVREAVPDVSHVLQWADHACMKAKAGGGRQVSEHRAFDRIAARRREEVRHLAEIEQALAENALCLHRMIIRDVHTSASEMQEILIRLRSPDGRLQGSSVLLATAERHGLMRRIDGWTVERVLTQLEERPGELPVALNLSAESLGHPEFSRHLLNRLDGARHLARRLIVEVSETTVARLTEGAWGTLAGLRQLGCRVALDEFGKGFSSFSLLRENSFDIIKIDRGLTADVATDPVKRAAISGIVGLAEALHLPTIAEYVADEASFTPLGGLGVRLAQGGYIGKPEPWPDA